MQRKQVISAAIIAGVMVLVAISVVAVTGNNASSSASKPTPTSSATLEPSASPTRVGQSKAPRSVASPSKSPADRFADIRDFPLTLTIKPACVSVGSMVNATAKTVKRVGVTIAAIYSDGDMHGGSGAGTVNAKGEYSIRFAVPPDAPLGRVAVFATAARAVADGGGSSVAEGSFEVRQIGQC